MWSPQNQTQLVEAVQQARSQKQGISVIGHGTKQNLGRPTTETLPLSLSKFSGIVDYQPDELIVTVKPGTPLSVLEQELLARRQHLVFEPADWGPILGAPPHQATIGGIVASAAAGPRRMKAGAVRDHLLGVHSVSGLGIEYACGGKVVKNVTGFDLPKLLSGSMGTLSIFSELTLRVGPVPETEVTLSFQGLSSHDAIALMRDAATSPLEISAAAHLAFDTPTTLLRLEGPTASIAKRASALLKDLATEAPMALLEGQQSRGQWQAVRDVSYFAASTNPLWRLLVPPSKAALVVTEIFQNWSCTALYDRAGAVVWLQSTSDEVGENWVRSAVNHVQGQATLFRAPATTRSTLPPFHPESPALALISQKIKAAFDPLGILEPGRMVRGR